MSNVLNMCVDSRRISMPLQILQIRVDASGLPTRLEVSEVSAGLRLAKPTSQPKQRARRVRLMHMRCPKTNNRICQPTAICSSYCRGRRRRRYRRELGAAPR